MAPEYSLEIQARIPSALSAIHNFIHLHDPDDRPLTGNGDDTMHDYLDENPPPPSPARTHEHEEVDARRDRIAQAMWDDYQQVCAERGVDMDEPIGSDDEDEFDDDEDDIL